MASKQNIFIAQLFELFKRPVSFDKKLGVYTNGDDNNYPERIEIIINNSVTAKACAHLMKKYIIGKGFGDEFNQIIIDKENDLTLYELLCDVAMNYTYQRGFTLHACGWDFTGEKPAITRINSPAFKNCRVGKKDDQDWSGKIAVFTNWTDQDEVRKAKKSDLITMIDQWNYNKKVIADQVKNQGGAKKYKGQLFFAHPDQYVYPLAHIDGSAYNDADSEFRASTYKNSSLRKGFMGKMAVVTPKMTGGLESVHPEHLSETDRKDLSHLQTKAKEFDKTLQSFIGAQNNDGIMWVQTDMNGDDLDKVIKFIKIETNINDKVFAHTEETTAKNIRKAFQNVPSILIESSDSSIFGDSGALLKQAKMFYQEELEDERRWIKNELNKVLKHFRSKDHPDGIQLPDIVPLHEVSEPTQEPEPTA